MMQHFCIQHFISVVMFQVLKTITNHGATRKKDPGDSHVKMFIYSRETCLQPSPETSLGLYSSFSTS